MAFLQVLHGIYGYIFGHWSPLIGTILVFTGINLIWDCFVRKPVFIGAFQTLGKKLAAYTTFFAIAHQFDRLLANKLLEFEGATAFFVAMFILMKEIQLLLALLKSKGIEIPWIITTRTKMLEETMKGIGPPVNEEIEAKIKELKSSIERLKELQNAGNQAMNEVQETLGNPDDEGKRD